MTFLVYLVNIGVVTFNWTQNSRASIVTRNIVDDVIRCTGQLLRELLGDRCLIYTNTDYIFEISMVKLRQDLSRISFE